MGQDQVNGAESETEFLDVGFLGQALDEGNTLLAPGPAEVGAG